MDKTKIDWCDSTWNPVTGCLHGCEYCYARGIAHRFSGGGEKWTGDKFIVLNEKVYGEESEEAIPYPYGFIPTFHRYRLNDYANKKGRNIFVCSMADLFGEWVPDEWIEEVFKACAKTPQHNYLFLTKNPRRYVDLIDKSILIKTDNMWYGSSVTTIQQLKQAAECFTEMPWNVRTFLSVEPILEDITEDEVWNDCYASNYMDWVIIGAETGRRKDKAIPDKKWVASILYDCICRSGIRIPVFMKSSLADIWGEPLIQEFPEALRRGRRDSSE